MRPENPNFLYLALGGNYSQGGGFYKTIDGAENWERIVTNIEFPDIQIVIPDPVRENTFYLGHRQYYDPVLDKSFPGGLFKTTDAGKTWIILLEDEFVSAIAVSPSNPDIIYAGCPDHNYHDLSRGRGVYRSKDGGANWEFVNKGLSSLRINCLSVSDGSPVIVYCGTGGNGLYRNIEQ